MKVVEVNINDLKPAEYNPRAMTGGEAKNLEDSIARFGMVDPLVVNRAKGRENVIIGGHQRYEVLNRSCYVMGIDPLYCDVIRKRYARFVGKENEWQKETPNR